VTVRQRPADGQEHRREGVFGVIAEKRPVIGRPDKPSEGQTGAGARATERNVQSGTPGRRTPRDAGCRRWPRHDVWLTTFACRANATEGAPRATACRALCSRPSSGNIVAMNWQNLLSVHMLSRVAGALAIIIAIVRLMMMRDLMGCIGWLIVGAGLLAWPSLTKGKPTTDA
jgi:hypothetical protein